MNILKINKAYVLFAAATLVLFLSSCATMKNDRSDQPSPEDRMDSHFKMGRKYYESGNYHRAERELTQALKYDPQDTNTLYMLGVIHSRNGQIEKGRIKFTQVIAIDSNYSKAYYNLGALYANEGPFQDVEKASILFRRYLELDPTTESRDNIENWLDQHDSNGRTNKDLKGLQPSGKPSDEDFKEWLRKQSEMMD